VLAHNNGLGGTSYADLVNVLSAVVELVADLLKKAVVALRLVIIVPSGMPLPVTTIPINNPLVFGDTVRLALLLVVLALSKVSVSLDGVKATTVDVIHLPPQI
jgi:hypothetical protein